MLFGAVAGTLLSVFEVSLPVGDFGLIIYGLFAGMFVGLLVVSLAETLKALPIFIRRVRIGSGLGIVILMVGLGKSVGHLVYYLLIYD